MGYNASNLLSSCHHGWELLLHPMTLCVQAPVRHRILAGDGHDGPHPHWPVGPPGPACCSVPCRKQQWQWPWKPSAHRRGWGAHLLEPPSSCGCAQGFPTSAQLAAHWGGTGPRGVHGRRCTGGWVCALIIPRAHMPGSTPGRRMPQKCTATCGAGRVHCRVEHNEFCVANRPTPYHMCGRSFKQGFSSVEIAAPNRHTGQGVVGVISWCAV